MSKNKENEQATKIYKELSKKFSELNSYNGYRIFYLEPGEGYKIGSLFAFPTREDIEESFGEMIVRQNINDTVYLTKKDEVLATLSQLKKLIDETSETLAPVFMPLLPPEYENGRDFQNLSAEALEPEQYKYEYIHKQIANAFDMARFQISGLTGKKVPEKWFLYGAGETCIFSYRLWSLCPQKTSAICCNSCIDSIVLPGSLNYPDGFGNYEDITGIVGTDRTMLEQYRDTDILYISSSYDPKGKKHEEEILKRLNSRRISIARFNGRTVVDFASFYIDRNSLNRGSGIKGFLDRIFKRSEPKLLSAGRPIGGESPQFGRLGDSEMQQYYNALGESQKRSGQIAKERLARAISSDSTR